MKKFGNFLTVTAVLLATACSESTAEKEKPRITYVSNESTIETIEPASDQNSQFEKITVPSVSAELNDSSDEKIVINKDTLSNAPTEPVADVTVKRIAVEDVETKTIDNVSAEEITTDVDEGSVVVSNIEEYNGNSEQPAGDAEVGQCYGKVKVAGTFKEVMEKVVVQQEKIQKKTVPAQYKYVNEEVIVREETTKYIEIPATYKKATETVVVEPEKKKITTIPAKYRTVKERVMVKPATKVWKKGRGLIEKTGSDGEIMCLVEEPAKYEMVEKRVLVEPERQEVSIIPEVKKVITKEVIDKPAKVQKMKVPAVKKVISKKVLVEPEKVIDIKIPAKYKTVAKKVPVTKSKVTWRPVLCDYNITPSVIMKLQEALTLRGFDTGGIDGVFGSKTSESVNRFQKSLGLESSGITLETLRALGVSY